MRIPRRELIRMAATSACLWLVSQRLPASHQQRPAVDPNLWAPAVSAAAGVA